jgi:hypothetical protein
METMTVQPEPTMKAEPRAEHAWLRQLLGEWVMESYDEGAGEKDSEWTESVRHVGDVWVVAESRGEMPDGGPATMIMTLGYDPQRQRFVGTFIGSMMTHLWVYDGELDASGKVLTLHAEGPDFKDPGKTVPYRDVIELESPDHRVLRSLLLGEDGTWKQIMSMRYRRVG